LRIDIVAAEVD